MAYKKAVDDKAVAPKKRIYKSTIPDEARASTLGIGGDSIDEPVPIYLSTPSEKLIEGTNNTTIVMGRDRTGNRMTGYGGKGHTQCGSIDIIAGRMGYLTRGTTSEGQNLFADPNFKYDATRIYLSQKTDVDDAFRLTPGVVGNHTAKSAVALKADHLRFIAREGVKIVTGTDKRNSQGGEVSSVNGIDLIAGNDSSDMQPFVKGKNMSAAIESLVEHLQKVISTIDTFLTWQMKYNSALMTHTHKSPFYGLDTSPSITLMKEAPNVMMNHLQGTKQSIMSIKANLVSYKMNYLSPAGSKYINSRYNHTN